VSYTLCYHFQLVFGIHTQVGSSDVRTQNFSSAKLPTQGMTYPGSWSRWILTIGLLEYLHITKLPLLYYSILLA
jgi:hypothetical protein